MESKSNMLVKKRKQIELDILKEERERLVVEKNKLNSKSASIMEVMLYILGMISTAIISTILFYSTSRTLIIFFILAYGIVFPKIIIYKDMYKKRKLTKDINNLNNEINNLVSELNLYNYTEEKSLNLDFDKSSEKILKDLAQNSEERIINDTVSNYDAISNSRVIGIDTVKDYKAKKLTKKKALPKYRVSK